MTYHASLYATLAVLVVGGAELGCGDDELLTDEPSAGAAGAGAPGAAAPDAGASGPGGAAGAAGAQGPGGAAGQAGAGGVAGTSGICRVALEDIGEVVYWVEDCPATYEAAEAWLDSCEWAEETDRWSGSCDGYLAARLVGAHSQSCYYDSSTRRLVGVYFDYDVPDFCGRTSETIVAGRYPSVTCPSNWQELEPCAQGQATAGAAGAGGTGGRSIASAAGEAP